MAPFTGPRTMPFPSNPVYENLFPRKAGVALEIIVVGGSIGGLSTAYNLKQAGHNIRVLERASGRPNAVIGLRVPPNMTKLLQHWGMGKRVRRVGIKCPRIDFIASKSGEWYCSLVHHKELIKELQADLYGLHFADLDAMVRELAEGSGVEIVYNSNVIDVDAEEGSVLLESGEYMKADLIVGADGPFSLVRERMLGRTETHRPGPFTTYSYTVPASKIKEDPKLRSLAEDGTWTCWMGDHRCALSYLVRPDTYLIQLVGSVEGAAFGWETSAPIAKLPLPEFEERIQKLMALSTNAIETQHVIQDPLEDWYHESGHVVLVGDAAHCLNPSTSHGAALAMEDAAVLGSLFSRLQSRNKDEIQRLLAAYQEIRELRCKVTLDSEFEKVAFSTIAEDDPQRAPRDEGFRAAREAQSLDWENVDEGALRQQWEEFKGSFGYEAYDAADDWWVDWGMLRVRMAAASGIEVPILSSTSGINGLSTRVVTVTSSLSEH